MASPAALLTLSSPSLSPKTTALKFCTPSSARHLIHYILANGCPLVMPYMKSSYVCGPSESKFLAAMCLILGEGSSRKR